MSTRLDGKSLLQANLRVQTNKATVGRRVGSTYILEVQRGTHW